MAKSSKKIYAVLKGRTPGIYADWFGPGGAHEQIEAFPGALYKGFQTFDEACGYARSMGFPRLPDLTSGKGRQSPGGRASGTGEAGKAGAGVDHTRGVVIYADGGCINNPGPGGYGVVVLQDGSRKERSGGYRLTTNNRMELMAAIVGLRELEGSQAGPVTVCTDSRYVVDGVSKGWAKKWRANGWMRDARSRAVNIDLWSMLLDLCDKLRPSFVWVKGHAGNKENERCDALAKKAAQSPDLPVDSVYEKGETSIPQPTLF
jgi:ribonuclease HI